MTPPLRPAATTPSVVDLVDGLATAAHDRVGEIKDLTWTMDILSINARIEAARAGEYGDGFGVVADQMQELTEQVSQMIDTLKRDVVERAASVAEAARAMARQAKGRRLRDLAHNLIEILDRNLYERSCDVRWWATDASVVACCADPETAPTATSRLDVILKAYTVYSDLWVIDRSGRVIAHGRPDTFPGVLGSAVQREAWFKAALATANGDAYATHEVGPVAAMGGRTCAIYATAVRVGGETEGEPIGVLAVLFDWETQSRAVVTGLALEDAERSTTRALIVDRDGLVLAASDGLGERTERIHLPAGERRGWFEYDTAMIGYALTPGYETYRGQGWFGVVLQPIASSRT